jgi:hypothetical protein
MIRHDDIDAAVARNIITATQAAQLADIARDRRQSRNFVLGSEERFKLLGGFNDFFIAVGVGLLGCGMAAGVMVSSPKLMIDTYPSRPIFSIVPVIGLLLCAGATWLLAEVLTKRLRLTAPSIVLTCQWLLFVLLATFAMGSWPRLNHNYFWLLPPTAGLVAVLVHYARFRLPFSLLLLALIVWAFALALVATVATQMLGFNADAAYRLTGWVSFGCGLAIFALAMSFDRQDPERLTSQADKGFWLHLAAAPLMVHPVAGPLINHPLFPTNLGPTTVTGFTVALIIAFTVVLALVALIVDRRALLVAGLGYLGGALVFALQQITGDTGLPGVITLLLLGAAIILLGIGWSRIRRAVINCLPDGDWRRSLPAVRSGSVGTAS